VTTAVVEFPESDQVLAWSSLDALVVGQSSASANDGLVLEMAQPVRSAPSRRGDVQADRPGSLVARWVPDPRGETGLICTWVPGTGTEASVSVDA
jgi:hypothetical protein